MVINYCFTCNIEFLIFLYPLFFSKSSKKFNNIFIEKNLGLSLSQTIGREKTPTIFLTTLVVVLCYVTQINGWLGEIFGPIGQNTKNYCRKGKNKINRLFARLLESCNLIGCNSVASHFYSIDVNRPDWLIGNS